MIWSSPEMAISESTNPFTHKTARTRHSLPIIFWVAFLKDKSFPGALFKVYDKFQVLLCSLRIASYHLFTALYLTNLPQ